MPQSRRLSLTTLALCLAGAFACSQYAPAQPPDVRAAFEEHYEKWRIDCAAVATSSLLESRLSSPHFRAIVEMGPAVLPMLVEKSLDDPGFTWGAWAFAEIAHIVPDPKSYPWCAESLSEWWAAGPTRSEDRFAELAARWRGLRGGGETLLWSEKAVFQTEEQWWKVVHEETELGETFRGLTALGIVILPAVVEATRAGDLDFLWLARELTGGQALVIGDTPRAKADGFLQWWEANKQDWLIPWPEAEAEE